MGPDGDHQGGATVPLKRPANVEEIACVVAFAPSPHASYVTAQCGECQQLGAAPDLDDLIVTVSEPTSSGALRVRGVTDSGNLTDVHGAVLNNDVRGVRRFVDANHPDGAVWMVRA
jgi:hypothetical protein